jgi:hypothetical protein
MHDQPSKTSRNTDSYFDRLDEQFHLRKLAEKYRPWFPFAFFVGGFVFDVLTLGRVVTMLNLAVVSVYALGVAICLVVLPRLQADEPESEEPADPAHSKLGTVEPNKWARWMSFALNFCLGSLFSALVVVYFRSAGEWLTLLTVLGLFGAMIWNEFSHWDDSQRHLLWAIYCVSLVMLLNFLVPHLVGSLSPLWFYLSSAAGVGLIWGLCWLAGHSFRTVRVATVAGVVLVGLYTAKLVPPVPLVMKNSLVGADFKKADGEYTCLADEQGFLTDIGLDTPTVVWKPGGHVAVLTAIFAPKDVEADMEHRWSREVDGDWVHTDTIPFHLRGGRKDGWRMWSRKQRIVPGKWRVETAVKDGAVLGHETFWVEEGEPAKERERLVL